MTIKEPDWNIIEGVYKAGEKSLRCIAAEYGTSEAAIRRRAKKYGWVRDAIGTVRKIVNEQMASGITQAQYNVKDPVRELMDEAIKAGVADMELGIGNARLIMQRVRQSLSVPEGETLEPRDLKVLCEANAGAIETIRRIRQLDEPANNQAKTATIFRVGGKDLTIDDLGW